MSGGVDIYKVNIDENTDLAQEHGVSPFPQFSFKKWQSVRNIGRIANQG